MIQNASIRRSFFLQLLHDIENLGRWSAANELSFGKPNCILINFNAQTSGNVFIEQRLKKFENFVIDFGIEFVANLIGRTHGSYTQ